MGKLGAWAKDNSPFLSLDDGETVQVEYLGYKMVQDRRDANKEKPVYKMAWLQPDGSKVVKLFETSAGNVAKFFDPLSDELGKAKKITMVSITRHGVGTDTKYKLVEMDASGQPTGVAAEAEDKDDFPF